MIRQTITIFTLLLFILFTCQCSTVEYRAIRGEADIIQAKITAKSKIYAVGHVSGEWIVFADEFPGHIKGQAVEGQSRNAKNNLIIRTIPLTEIVAIQYDKASSPEMVVVKVLGGFAGLVAAGFLVLAALLSGMD